ncbi:MAG: hypothetical protein HQ542_04700 [Bacteroidia bacterium]|nr:hypothetical protein [Bacteroidia bacterium]
MKNYTEAYRFLGELFSSTTSFLDEKAEDRINEMQTIIRKAQEEAATQKKLEQRRLWTIFLLILVGCAMIFVIAHDLKNPFNTIIGFSDLLNTEFNTLTLEERKLAIENTHKSAINAFALLEQLLSWARIQTGAFNLELELIDLSHLIDEVVNLLSNAIKFTHEHGIIEVSASASGKNIIIIRLPMAGS